VAPEAASLPALCVLALLLGARHGLDPDHLACIDGLARAGARCRPRAAALSGVLFSLGHGAVVLITALAAALAGARWTPPPWLSTAGMLIAVGLLAGLGVANLRGLAAAPHSHGLTGLRARLLAILPHPERPSSMIAVGALFAISFDTLSQAAIFAALASRFGGIAPALGAAAAFAAGVTAVDGLNGWWISSLAVRADRRALAASRAMTAGVALVSLLLAAILLAELMAPSVASWLARRQLALSAAVALGALFAFAGGMWAARLAPPNGAAD
jgi:high-affinity nickel-transport protein